MCALQLNMCVHHTEIETRECRRSDADEPNPEGFVPRRRQEWRACGLDTWTGGRRLPLRRTNYLPRGRADRPNDRLFARSRRGLWSLGCQRGSLDRRRARAPACAWTREPIATVCRAHRASGVAAMFVAVRRVWISLNIYLYTFIMSRWPS